MCRILQHLLVWSNTLGLGPADFSPDWVSMIHAVRATSDLSSADFSPDGVHGLHVVSIPVNSFGKAFTIFVASQTFTYTRCSCEQF